MCSRTGGLMVSLRALKRVKMTTKVIKSSLILHRSRLTQKSYFLAIVNKKKKARVSRRSSKFWISRLSQVRMDIVVISKKLRLSRWITYQLLARACRTLPLSLMSTWAEAEATTLLCPNKIRAWWRRAQRWEGKWLQHQRQMTLCSSINRTTTPIAIKAPPAWVCRFRTLPMSRITPKTGLNSCHLQVHRRKYSSHSAAMILASMAAKEVRLWAAKIKCQSARNKLCRSHRLEGFYNASS